MTLLVLSYEFFAPRRTRSLIFLDTDDTDFHGDLFSHPQGELIKLRGNRCYSVVNT